MPDIFVAKKKTKKPSAKLEGKQKRPILAAFVKRPKGINFETQGRKEKIVLLLRRHWVTNLPWFLLAILMLFAPIFHHVFFFLDFLPVRFQILSLIGWYLLVTAFVFQKFLSWFFNVNIVTDERIIDIDFPTLLYHHMGEAEISQIQDVSIKVGGFVQSLLNYGDVLVQTAGTKPEICFESVPQPTRVVEMINYLINKKEEKSERRRGK